jgi:hypothetical protein
MIVAAQAPREIHNQVVSNCTTQFFGKQNAPAAISAAQEIIGASGGKADDIGKLKAGEFYFATEGSGKHARLPQLSSTQSADSRRGDLSREAARLVQPARLGRFVRNRNGG